jgi:hypothetical protein
MNNMHGFILAKKMHGFSKQFTIIFNSTIEKFILHGST